MMKKNRSRLINILFLIAIVLLIVPQTRTPIQVFLHKGLSLFGPSIIDESDRDMVDFSSWRLMDLNGKEVNFQSFKGEVTLVNFWATWCPPCIAEMPSLQALYNDYNERINIVLISNEAPQTVEEFIAGNEYSFNVHRPLEGYPSSFEVRSIPRTYIISKGGQIIIDKKGSANWNSRKVRDELDRLIAE